jgi:hypothetical protein
MWDTLVLCAREWSTCGWLAYVNEAFEKNTCKDLLNVQLNIFNNQWNDKLYFFCVFQSTELINMAMLTGKMVSLPMKIYSLSQGGKVADITSATTCHSGNDDVLKVSQQYIYIQQ